MGRGEMRMDIKSPPPSLHGREKGTPGLFFGFFEMRKEDAAEANYEKKGGNWVEGSLTRVRQRQNFSGSEV